MAKAGPSGLTLDESRQIAAFGRSSAKAANVEAVVAEAMRTLHETAGAEEVRVVYSADGKSWTEWQASDAHISVSANSQLPEAPVVGCTTPFDPENPASGFVSMRGGKRGKEHVLEAIAPEIWTALLLRTALNRAHLASLSESGRIRDALKARDSERRMISQELHDDLGQTMASLKLSLKWAGDALQTHPDLKNVQKELSAASETIGGMLNSIRDLSHILYPRALDSFGIGAAVKELTLKAAGRSGVQVTFGEHGTARPLPKAVGIGLYRCCQEALSNALRHSGATKIAVDVRFSKDEIALTVEDNGCGFNPRTLYNTNGKIMTSGFWTIRQRMADLQGAFRVSTAKRAGTVIELTVPISSSENNGRKRRKDKNTHRG